MATGKFFRSESKNGDITKKSLVLSYLRVNDLTERKRIFSCLHLLFSLKTVGAKRLKKDFSMLDE